MSDRIRDKLWADVYLAALFNKPFGLTPEDLANSAVHQYDKRRQPAQTPATPKETLHAKP